MQQRPTSEPTWTYLYKVAWNALEQRKSYLFAPHNNIQWVPHPVTRMNWVCEQARCFVDYHPHRHEFPFTTRDGKFMIFVIPIDSELPLNPTSFLEVRLIIAELISQYVCKMTK